MSDFKLPDVGEGLTEAEIVTWKVQVGDIVKINDVVVEIETAKSLVELPSPYAGTVQALHVPEGETVEVGTPIISIGDGAGATAEVAGPDTVPGEAAPPEIDLSNPASGGGENQTLVGYGPRETSAQRRPRRGAASPASEAGALGQVQLQGAFGQGGAESSEVVDGDEEPVPSAPDAGPPEPARATSTATSTETTTGSELRVLAKPPVRKLAKDLGVDLRTLTPSGPDRTVSRADVQAAAAASSTPPTPKPAVATGGTSRPADGDRREPVKGVRKAMAASMVASAFTAPHVTEWVTVDVTRTTRLVERLRTHRDFREVKVSPLLVVAKALCLAVRRTPEANATWDEEAQEVVFKSAVNLGIAAATPRGLVVPNVKDAQALSLPELGTAINDLARTAREGRTQPADMAGGSITISNVGVFGVDAGTPIINPGESAILAFGAVRPQPWVHKGSIKVRQVTTLALSFDHRLIDGAQGSRFLSDIAGVLEDPASALLL